MLAGKVSVGPATLFANYENSDHSNYAGPAGKAKNKTSSVSADLALGPGKVLVAYANIKITRSSTTAASNRATFSVGWDYNFSKRTDLYVVGSNNKITGFGRANSFAVGLRHWI